MRYRHILIPKSAKFVPPVESVVRFLERVREEVPKKKTEFTAFLQDRDHPRAVRRGKNPLTGEEISYESPTSHALEKLSNAVKLASTLRKFDVVMAADENEGIDLAIPILEDLGAIEEAGWVRWTKPLFASFECSVRPEPVSMSDLHEESETDLEAVSFDEPCPDDGRPALYSNPETLEVLSVPGCGSARFWISVEFGKWIFPYFGSKGHLSFASREFLAIARESFDTDFAQGCNWG
jgi:hypothetical protein